MTRPTSPTDRRLLTPERATKLAQGFLGHLERALERRGLHSFSGPFPQTRRAQQLALQVQHAARYMEGDAWEEEMAYDYLCALSLITRTVRADLSASDEVPEPTLLLHTHWQVIVQRQQTLKNLPQCALPADILDQYRPRHQDAVREYARLKQSAEVALTTRDGLAMLDMTDATKALLTTQARHLAGPLVIQRTRLDLHAQGLTLVRTRMPEPGREWFLRGRETAAYTSDSQALGRTAEELLLEAQGHGDARVTARH